MTFQPVQKSSAYWETAILSLSLISWWAAGVTTPMCQLAAVPALGSTPHGSFPQPELWDPKCVSLTLNAWHLRALVTQDSDTRLATLNIHNTHWYTSRLYSSIILPACYSLDILNSNSIVYICFFLSEIMPQTLSGGDGVTVYRWNDTFTTSELCCVVTTFVRSTLLNDVLITWMRKLKSSCANTNHISVAPRSCECRLNTAVGRLKTEMI